MNAIRLLAIGVFVGLLGATAVADEKKADNAKLLVGKWQVTKADEGTVPPMTVIEFSKDGKLKATMTRDGKEMTREGTYKVDGDKVSVTLLRDDGTENKKTITIKKISDKELSITDDEGKGIEMTRKN